MLTNKLFILLNLTFIFKIVSYESAEFVKYLLPDSHSLKGDLLFVGDFNGDGRDDFLRYEEDTADLFLSDGSHSFTKVTLPESSEFKGDLISIYIGDFNGDGKDDFLRQEKGKWDDDQANTANIFLSVGDGSFSKIELPEDYGLKGDYTNLYIGDFNGDGRDDFIRQEKGDWSDDETNTANVFFSAGDGSFNKIQLPEEYGLKGDYTNLYIGDFNGDGKDDFIRQEKRDWSDDETNTADVFLSVGDGTFQQIVLPEEFDLKGDLTNLYIGDFNGDGRDDFIRQEKGDWDDDEARTAEVFLSVGDGSFQLVTFSPYLSPFFKGDYTNLYIADFNGDGKDDFLKQEKGRWDNDEKYMAQVFLAIGDGHFVGTLLPENFKLKGDLTNLYIGDFNGDGRDDFIRQEKGRWARDDINTAEVFFSINTAISENKITNYHVGDFNGDGFDDFIRQDETNISSLYQSQGDGEFEKIFLDPNFALNADFTTLYIGDFNGDGKDDILRQEKGTWSDDATNTATVLLAIEDNNFNMITLPEEFDLKGDLTNLHIGDFNGDGKDDFLRQERDAWNDDQANTASIFLSNGDGTFRKIDLPEEFDLKGNLTKLYIGDFNGDGRDDFLRQERDAWNDDQANTASIFLSDGDGTFQKIVLPEEFNLKGDVTTLYVGDFNGDNKDDFLKQELDRSVATMFLSNGDGTFGATTLPEDYLLKGNLTMLYTGDFDADGKDDFFRQTKTEHWDENVGNMFLSNETTIFDMLADYKLRGDFTVMHIGDFNGDGKTDFLRLQTGLWGDKDFSILNILFSLGDGTFDKKDLQELTPKPRKESAQVKTEIALKLQRPLAKLADALGYSWCSGPSGWVGEEFDIVEAGEDIILKAQPSPYGDRSYERLQIVFSDWNFVIKGLQIGDPVVIEKVLKETDEAVAVNEDFEKIEQIGQISKTSSMTINVYDLHTFSWKVGAKFSEKGSWSVPFVGGQEFTFELSFEVSESDQIGTVTAQGNSTTLTHGVTGTVPPRKQRKMDLEVYGIKAIFDPSAAFIEAQFSVEFRGFLRWGGGANPDSNYHRIYRGSEEQPTINFKMGNNETSFHDDLQIQLDFPEQSIWDWDLLEIDHGPELSPILNDIFDQSTYRDSYYFSVDATQGTSLEVTVHKAEDLP